MGSGKGANKRVAITTNEDKARNIAYTDAYELVYDSNDMAYIKVKRTGRDVGNFDLTWGGDYIFGNPEEVLTKLNSGNPYYVSRISITHYVIKDVRRTNYVTYKNETGEETSAFPNFDSAAVYAQILNDEVEVIKAPSLNDTHALPDNINF